jgi:hypothetical protein
MNTSEKVSDIVGVLYNMKFRLHDAYLVLLRLQDDYRFDVPARQAVALLTREDRRLSEVWHYALADGAAANRGSAWPLLGEARFLVLRRRPQQHFAGPLGDVVDLLGLRHHRVDLC